VYVVKADNTIERRSVKSGPDFGDNQVAILSGVKPGEQVVTTGIDRLNNGTKVEIVTPNAGEAAAADGSSKAREQSGGVDKATTGADKTAPDADKNTAGKDSGSK
jgi:multidrug efflux system membrane fusion protein